MICDSDGQRLDEVGERFGIERRASSLDDVLDSDVEAVHLVTAIPQHAEHTIAVMNSRTHAISPLLALAERRAVEVRCFGSGSMREELRRQYGNPHPIETAIFKLEGVDIAAEATRSLFHTAVGYTEAFSVYAERMSVEWPQVRPDQSTDRWLTVDALAVQDPPLRVVERANHPATIHRDDRAWQFFPVRIEDREPPDRQDLLPQSIRRFTRAGVYDGNHLHESFIQGGGHGGSHPHLVHEFVSSVVAGRPPAIDHFVAADWTAAGICAHESAMHAGAAVSIPAFDTVRP